MSNTFVVANGLNTSYIDSLIIALFYKSSHLQDMLNQCPDDSKFVYLQELIGNNFIDPVRRNYSLDISVVNEIRNYSLICGWKDGGNITDLYNVVDYMNFLIKGLGFSGIEFELVEYNGSENESVKTLTLSHIELNASEKTSTKILLDKWTDKNIKKNKGSLICHRFKEIPMMMPIYINRINEDKNYVSCQVDIMRRIKFKNHNNKNQHGVSWVIHSIICFTNSGGGNYYSIVNANDNQWYLFSNDKIPSLIKIQITDEDISEKIKQECVLIFYRLDDELCKF